MDHILGEVIIIRALEQRILAEGQILPGEVLKVGSFLNQQIDTVLLKEIGGEIARLFGMSRSGIRNVIDRARRHVEAQLQEGEWI